MFRLVVVNQELFAAFVTGHPFGEDVVHRRYHYCFLATQRTRELSLVKLGQSIGQRAKSFGFIAASAAPCSPKSSSILDLANATM